MGKGHRRHTTTTGEFQTRNRPGTPNPTKPPYRGSFPTPRNGTETVRLRVLQHTQYSVSPVHNGTRDNDGRRPDSSLSTR